MNTITMNTINMPESNMAEYAAEMAEDKEKSLWHECKGCDERQAYGEAEYCDRCIDDYEQCVGQYTPDMDDIDGTDGSEPDDDIGWEGAWSSCLGCGHMIPSDHRLCDDCWATRIEMADAENKARENSGLTESTLEWYDRYVWAVMDGDERVHLLESSTRRLQALRNTLLTRQPERVWLWTASQLVYQDVFHLTGWNAVVLYLGYIIGRRYREGESQ